MTLSFFSIFPLVTHAQEWNKIKEIQLSKSPTAYAVDYQGNFFLGFADGSLTKYDSEGEKLENFSLSNNSAISLIDVQNNLKPFLFYFDNQQITILDRFSSVPKNYALSDLGVQIGMLACPSPDGDIWVLENNPQRIKKISTSRKNTMLEVQPMIGDSLIKMQAYQNLLFIATTDGLHTFDQFGGKLYTVEHDQLIGFQLVESRLILFSKNKITRLNPLTGKILSSRSVSFSTTGMLRLKQGYLSIKGKTLSFYQDQ